MEAILAEMGKTTDTGGSLDYTGDNYDCVDTDTDTDTDHAEEFKEIDRSPSPADGARGRSSQEKSSTERYVCMHVFQNCRKTMQCNFSLLVSDNYASSNKPARPKSFQNIVIHSGTM